MTALDTRVPTSAPVRRTVLTLARIEARRYARSPLFVVGLVLLALETVMEVSQSWESGAKLVAGPVFPALTIGLFGLIIMGNQTASSDWTGDVMTACPVPERSRTAALALAALLPAAVTAVWSVVYIGAYLLRPPVEGAWWFGTMPTTHLLAIFLAGGVVASYGGPVLGLAIARWWRWPAAPLASAVILLVVSFLTSGWVEAIQGVRQVMPWTGWFGGDDGLGHTILYTGNPVWWLVYTICLCALAVMAALLHDPTVARARLLRTAVAIGVVAVLACLSAMFTGPQQTQYSPQICQIGEFC